MPSLCSFPLTSFDLVVLRVHLDELPISITRLDFSGFFFSDSSDLVLPSVKALIRWRPCKFVLVILFIFGRPAINNPPYPSMPPYLSIVFSISIYNVCINISIHPPPLLHHADPITDAMHMPQHSLPTNIGMGNCQASDAATVVIVHPGKKVERMFRSVIAREIMDSNPGHYVALVVTSAVVKSVNGSAPVKQLKLLRPDDTLLIGQVYRLISFEDVLKEFAAKKCLKLGKLMNERGLLRLEKKKDVAGAPSPAPIPPSVKVHNSRAGGGWKPGLKTISEIGN
ncbi:hypothetical protein L6452_41130 [Arctium lappa]|uniref:Uncharacterized protein n=1 Tax=Arctium lappa TaxID=4217 RepID=A0ACB8XNV0_ARCLA|nr:hypothetical protein L6452_41130 [Arctium lappa]